MIFKYRVLCCVWFATHNTICNTPRCCYDSKICFVSDRLFGYSNYFIIIMNRNKHNKLRGKWLALLTGWCARYVRVAWHIDDPESSVSPQSVFGWVYTHTHTNYGVMYIIYVDKIARTQHINVNVYIYVYIPNNCRSRRERRSVRGKLPSCNVRFHRLCLLYINFNRVTSWDLHTRICCVYKIILYTHKHIADNNIHEQAFTYTYDYINR